MEEIIAIDWTFWSLPCTYYTYSMYLCYRRLNRKEWQAWSFVSVTFTTLFHISLFLVFTVVIMWKMRSLETHTKQSWCVLYRYTEYNSQNLALHEFLWMFRTNICCCKCIVYFTVVWEQDNYMTWKFYCGIVHKAFYTKAIEIFHLTMFT